MGERPFDRPLHPQSARQRVRELGGDEPRRVKVELHRKIDAGDVVEIVDEAPGGPAPEDEALDEAHAQQHERRERESRGGRELRPSDAVRTCHDGPLLHRLARGEDGRERGPAQRLLA